jgi:hypothetical protein
MSISYLPTLYLPNTYSPALYLLVTNLFYTYPTPILDLLPALYLLTYPIPTLYSLAYPILTYLLTYLPCTYSPTLYLLTYPTPTLHLPCTYSPTLYLPCICPVL